MNNSIKNFITQDWFNTILQPTSSLTQYRPPRPNSPVVLQVPMASIIRGATLPHAAGLATQTGPGAQLGSVMSQALTGQPQTVSATVSATQPNTPTLHTFPSHMPRGEKMSSILIDWILMQPGKP